jgi:integrase
MTREQVLKGLAKLGLRERLIWKLAVFGGLRPGEIFGLQRGTSSRAL